MSGGKWDYIQYRFTDVADDIQREIDRSGKPKTKEELEHSKWLSNSGFNPDDDKINYKYPDKVVERFKEGVRKIKEAQIYMQRIDYLLSGDDGEESFLSRLEDDLSQI